LYRERIKKRFYKSLHDFKGMLYESNSKIAGKEVAE
jgi:hypothetical protein